MKPQIRDYIWKILELCPLVLIPIGCASSTIQRQNEEWAIKPNTTAEIEVKTSLSIQVVFHGDQGQTHQLWLDHTGKIIEQNIASGLAINFPGLSFKPHSNEVEGERYFLRLEIEGYVQPSESNLKQWASILTFGSVEYVDDYLYTIKSSIVKDEVQICQKQQVEKVTYRVSGPDFYESQFHREQQSVYRQFGIESLSTFIRMKQSSHGNKVDYLLVCDK